MSNEPGCALPAAEMSVQQQADRVYEILSGLMVRLAQDRVDHRAVATALLTYTGHYIGVCIKEDHFQEALDGACAQLRDCALQIVKPVANA